MKFVINNHIVLSQEPEGPIKDYIDAFAERVTKQGYALSSISAQVSLVAFFELSGSEHRTIGVRTKLNYS
jgi:hypothetical protein